jgi:hypothetical protein
MLSANETVETSVTSICLSVACFKIKTDHMQNKLLYIESSVRYEYHIVHVMMEYCYIGIREVDNGEIEIIPFVIKLSY